MVFAELKQKGRVVKITFKGVPSCVEDVTNYLSQLQKIYDMKKEFIVLYNCIEVGWVPFKYIKIQADFMRTHTNQNLMIRVAIVIPGARRFLLDSLFVVKKPSCKDTSIFDNLEKAENYLRKAKFTQK